MTPRITILILLLSLMQVNTLKSQNSIAKEGTKYGVLGVNKKSFILNPEFDELYQVTRSSYVFGYAARKGKIWYFYDHTCILKADSLDFDKWLSNSSYNYSWVMKKDTVFCYDFKQNKRKPVRSDTVNYANDSIILIKNKDTLSIGFNKNGVIKIKPIWKEDWSNYYNDRKKKNPYLLTNKKHTGGAFYSHEGNLIVKFTQTLLYLNSKDLLLKLEKPSTIPDQYRYALGILDVENKKIISLTGYDFRSIFETTVKTEKGDAVAKAIYPDKREVYLLKDGTIVPVK